MTYNVGDKVTFGETVQYTPPQPNAALVVGPDDHLVISLPADISDAEFHAFQDDFHTRLDVDRVTIVRGAEQLAVIRNAHEPEATQ